MNGKQRIQAALAGQRADRVPVSWYTHFPDQTDNTVRDQVIWARAAGMDMLCVETDGYMEFDCGKTDLGTPEGLRSLRPHKPHDPYIEGQLDRARRIADGLRDEAAVTYMVFTPFSTIKHSTHSETRVMELLRQDPGAVEHAMRVIEEDNFLLMDRLSREAGLDGIFLSLQNGEIDRYTSDEYQRLLAPVGRPARCPGRSAVPLYGFAPVRMARRAQPRGGLAAAQLRRGQLGLSHRNQPGPEGRAGLFPPRNGADGRL